MEEQEYWVEDALRRIREKMAWVSEKNKDKIPYRTDESGNYDDRSDPSGDWRGDDGINWWTNGFWGGMMWLMYQDTGEARYAQIARISEEKLDRCFREFYGLHHDVGFMYLLTAAADWRLTGNPESRKRALHAAALLAGRFHPAGGYIRAWNDPAEGDTRDTRGWTIIDSMLNINLLYWASEETGDPGFRQIAMLHADTVREHFVREDGSVRHIVEFDPETGRRVRELGGQGYAEGSAWTRGQGWAVYGFVLSYLHTQKRKYLETARRVADYIVSVLPESYLLPVDFRQPEYPAWEDSCGACVIACGLLEISQCLREEDAAAAVVYRNAAVRILEAITRLRADFSSTCDAIVQNCSAAYHCEEHHITMSYADYFYMEGIRKIIGGTELLW